MLAEIFMLRLENAPSRANQPNGSTTTASDTRFVPIALPRH